MKKLRLSQYINNITVWFKHDLNLSVIWPEQLRVSIKYFVLSI